MLIALTFNAFMYENGDPLFKIWNFVNLRERIVSDFDTCMRVFMKFVKTVLNIRKGRQILIVSRMRFGEDLCFVPGRVGCIVDRLIRLVESSKKSCENCL